MVREPNNPLTKAIRRLSEIDDASSSGDVFVQARTACKHEHSDGPVPKSLTGNIFQFKELTQKR